MTRASLIALVLVGACCGNAPPAARDHGVVRLAWTLDGQPPSDASCAGIDRVLVTIESTPLAAVTVEPIPCAHGLDWERDDMPEGSDTVVIDALDADGRARFETLTNIGVTATRPATPTAVDLRPL
jgi:hypothetical protein